MHFKLLAYCDLARDRIALEYELQRTPFTRARVNYKSNKRGSSGDPPLYFIVSFKFLVLLSERPPSCLAFETMLYLIDSFARLLIIFKINPIDSIRSPGPVAPRDVHCEGFNLSYTRIANDTLRNQSKKKSNSNYLDKKVDDSIEEFLKSLSQIGPELLSVSSVIIQKIFISFRAPFQF